MITCTKKYTDFPFAHRQPNHKGHCRLIHGHNWSFEFEFGATELDGNGFVIDFGGLKPVKDLLTELFDHTLVLNADDPHIDNFEENLAFFAKIITVPNCGAEGLAEYLQELVDNTVSKITEGRVRVMRCTVYEDSKNSATFKA